jgi:hypothetical protein
VEGMGEGCKEEARRALCTQQLGDEHLTRELVSWGRGARRPHLIGDLAQTQNEPGRLCPACEGEVVQLDRGGHDEAGTVVVGLAASGRGLWGGNGGGSRGERARQRM